MTMYYGDHPPEWALAPMPHAKPYTNLDVYSEPISEDDLQRLRKAAIDRQPVVWQPKDGDVLEGRIVGSTVLHGPFGNQDALVIAGVDGKRYAYWLTNYLRNQLLAQSAEPGDLMRIDCRGQKISTVSGRKYNDIAVYVLRTGEQ